MNSEDKNLEDDILSCMDEVESEKSLEEMVAECRADPELRAIVTEHVKKNLGPDVRKVMDMCSVSIESKDGRRAMAETMFVMGSYQLVMRAVLIIDGIRKLKIATGHPDVTDTGICPNSGEPCDTPHCPFMKGVHPLLHLRAMEQRNSIPKNLSDQASAVWSSKIPVGEA